MDGKKIDTPESLAADLERWAAEDVHCIGRDVLRRTAHDFARRIRALAFSVPEVAAVGPDGKPREIGFYFEMPARQCYPISDGTPKDIPTTRCLVYYSPGDWGMANTPRLAETTPRHRFVPTGRFVSLLEQPGETAGPEASSGGLTFQADYELRSK